MRIVIMITMFLLSSLLTCVGCCAINPFWGCIGAISSALLGSVISVILDAVDTHGQGLRLWLQHFKYRKMEGGGRNVCNTRKNYGT